MTEPDHALFRRSALERLASPERIDERLALPRYAPALLVLLLILLVGTAGFAAWLLSAR